MRLPLFTLALLGVAGLFSRPSFAAPPTTSPPPGPLPTLPAPAPTSAPPPPATPAPPTTPASPAPPPTVTPLPAQPPVYAPPPPGYYYPPPPQQPQLPPPDAHSHAGFFLRMALGFGRMTDSTAVDGGAYAGAVDAKGGTVSLELDIGGALSRGVIVAGSYMGTFLNNATLDNDTRQIRLSRAPQLSILAPMVDVYPVPTGGFHAGGALGLASLRARNDADPTNPDDASGFGFSAHVGYEGWVGNYWGIGGLARILYARTKGDYGGGTATDKMLAFTLAFSATYN